MWKVNESKRSKLPEDTRIYPVVHPNGYIHVGSPPRLMSWIPGLFRSPASVNHQGIKLEVSLGHRGTTVFTSRSFNIKLGSPSPHKVSPPLHTKSEGQTMSTMSAWQGQGFS